jgi:hypothetical protein
MRGRAERSSGVTCAWDVDEPGGDAEGDGRREDSAGRFSFAAAARVGAERSQISGGEPPRLLRA